MYCAFVFCVGGVVVALSFDVGGFGLEGGMVELFDEFPDEFPEELFDELPVELPEELFDKLPEESSVELSKSPFVELSISLEGGMVVSSVAQEMDGRKNPKDKSSDNNNFLFFIITSRMIVGLQTSKTA